MAQLTIITVGTLKEKYLADAVSEYKKRLSQYARVEEINLKEETTRGCPVGGSSPRTSHAAFRWWSSSYDAGSSASVG